MRARNCSSGSPAYSSKRHGEEVIEEHVGDDARVVAVLGEEHAPERRDGGMRVGERVDAPMLEDARGDGGREAVAAAVP